MIPKTKFLLTAVLCMSLAFTATAQDLQVLSAGGIASGDNAFTLGETFVGHFMQSSSLLTEGFHQPDYGLTIAVDPAIMEGAFSLSPNPAAEVSFLHAIAPVQQPCPVVLYDLHGRHLWESVIEPGQERLAIPLHALSQSMYFLRVEAQSTVIFKLEKIGI